MSIRHTEKERVSAKYASDTSKIRRTAVILKHLPARRPLGKVITDRRLELGIAQSKLAHHVNLESSMIAKIEDGSRFPDVKYLPAFAKALRIDLVALWMSFMQQRCPEIHRAVSVQFNEPEIMQRLNVLPDPLKNTIIDMINSLYLEESREKTA